MSENTEIDRSVEPQKKKRKSMPPTGESDKWIKKSTGEIWKFIHHKEIFKTLMSRDYWKENNKFTIPSNDPIFHNLFIFCLSKSALQNDDGGLENDTLTEHEQRIKETWEKGEANTVKIGRKCTREHNRAREHTIVIQMEVAGAISNERAARKETIDFYHEYYCYRRPEPKLIDEPQASNENDLSLANQMMTLQTPLLVVQDVQDEVPDICDIEVIVQPVELNSSVCVTCGHDPSVAVVPEPDETPAQSEADAIADLEAELEDMSIDPSFILNPPNESRTTANIAKDYQNYTKLAPICEKLFEDAMQFLVYTPSTGKWTCQKENYTFRDHEEGFTVKTILIHLHNHFMKLPDANHKEKWFVCPVCLRSDKNPSHHYRGGCGLKTCLVVQYAIFGVRLIEFFFDKYGLQLNY